MRLRVDHGLPLMALALLSGCLGAGHKNEKPVSLPIAGPAADYPMVIGEPFSVGETLYRPEDKLNYDAVGRASMGGQGGAHISISHKTLPLPSYAEVTSLESGRTILVRVERRGPMLVDRLIELSPGAAAQLGVSGDGTPIRIRRVNPPEPERALLRTGGQASERMETPKSLVAILLRKLEPAAPVAVSDSRSTTEAITPAKDFMIGGPLPPTAPSPSPAPQGRTRPKTDETADLVVQAGAFSSRQRADALAARLGGNVSPSGRLFLVRIGPFKIRAEADAALAKVRAAGYRDARIQRP